MNCCGNLDKPHKNEINLKAEKVKQIEDKQIEVKNRNSQNYNKDNYYKDNYYKDNYYKNSSKTYHYYDNYSINKIDNFELETIGFHNIGNSCYMNSFLQILFHCPGFLVQLKQNYRHLFDESCLIKSLIDLSEYPEINAYLNEIRKYMSRAYSEYGSHKQNDSQDFGKDLINEIIKSIKGDIDHNDDYSLFESENECELENIEQLEKNKKIKYQDYIKKYKKEEIFIEKMFEIDESEIKINQKRENLFFNTSLYIELFFPKNDKVIIYTLEDLLNFKYNNNFQNNELKGYKKELQK